MCSSPSYVHRPVLLKEVLYWLNPQPGQTFLDATVGGGGHSYAIGEKIAPGGTLVGLDRDREAIQAAAKFLEPLRSSIHILLIPTDFASLPHLLAQQPGFPPSFDGIVFDLGISSHQLDTPRGFTFRREEPLDMRMDQTQKTTAAELLTHLPAKEIERILREYGEERWSRSIARAIVAEREQGRALQTTLQLAALVERVVPRRLWPHSIHVATRTFQALRIAVNDELNQLRQGLEAAIQILKPGGRIVVISFHSLEDRLVKRFFAEKAGKQNSSMGSPFPLPSASQEPFLEILTKKPVRPSAEELQTNPRARSGRLRAARRRDTIE